MTLDTPTSSDQRVHETEYTVLVTDELDTVLNEAYPHPSARRDGVIELLLANHDEVEEAEVVELLASRGGADADAALNDVVALFNDRGAQISVTTGERQRDVGPLWLYTAFTDYGNGSYWIEHYPTKADRLAELRQRALSLTEDSSSDFSDADEEACQRVIDGALARTRGRVVLIEAIRHSVDESWAGRYPDDDSL